MRDDILHHGVDIPIEVDSIHNKRQCFPYTNETGNKRVWFKIQYIYMYIEGKT